MAFPSGPTNNQQATVNGITYVYNSTKTAWLRASTTGANLTANSLSITSNTPSTSTTSGALLVTGGVGIQGDLYASNISVAGVTNFTSLNVSGEINTSGTVTALNILNPFLLAGM